MSRFDEALRKLSIMINEMGSLRFFEKGGPLEWFSLTRTFSVASIKLDLSDKQCDLVDRVFDDYLRLRSSSNRFLMEEASRQMVDAIQLVQKNKPKVASPRDKSRAMRLAKIVHELTEPGVVHIGLFSEAESIVGELGLEDMNATWQMIHIARLAYLSHLYGKSPG